jgi:hypothetical protein
MCCSFNIESIIQAMIKAVIGVKYYLVLCKGLVNIMPL